MSVQDIYITYDQLEELAAGDDIHTKTDIGLPVVLRVYPNGERVGSAYDGGEVIVAVNGFMLDELRAPKHSTGIVPNYINIIFGVHVR